MSEVAQIYFPALVGILNVVGSTLFVLELRNPDRRCVFVRYSFNIMLILKHLTAAPLLPQATRTPTVKKWNKVAKPGYIAAPTTLSPNTTLPVPDYEISLL